jgi:hypothetical protein
MLHICFFKSFDIFWVWLLGRCLNPKRSPVFSGPLSAFKAFESVHHQRGPWLMHRNTHSIIFSFFVKSLISFKNLLLSLCLLN